MVDLRFGNVVEKLKNFNNMQDQKTAQEMAEQNAKAQMDAVKQKFIQECRAEALRTAQYLFGRHSDAPSSKLIEEAEKIYQWLIAVAK